MTFFFLSYRQGKKDRNHSDNTRVKLQPNTHRAYFERRLAILQNKAIKHLVNFNWIPLYSPTSSYSAIQRAPTFFSTQIDECLLSCYIMGVFFLLFSWVFGSLVFSTGSRRIYLQNKKHTKLKKAFFPVYRWELRQAEYGQKQPLVVKAIVSPQHLKWEHMLFCCLWHQNLVC